MMKNIPVYILLLSLSCVIGGAIGYQGFFVHIPLPPGDWEKIFTGNEYPFNSSDIESLHILSVTRHSITDHAILYFYSSYGGGGGKLYKCDIDANVCPSTDELTVPLDPTLITFTHDVQLSEIPPIPILKNAIDYPYPFVDLIKVESHVSDDISDEYYVMLRDGTIWRWGHYSVMYSFSIIKRYLLGIVGGIVGLALAIIVIILTTRLSKRLAKND